MLDTAPILWLQAWASPALSKTMLAVSILGYVPSCLAVAIACAFGWRLRLGLTLILAIVFAGAMTTVAKTSFASPRPDAVDARVRTPEAFEARLPPAAATASDPADDFGFPSGHVATTAAWALGLAWFRRRPWHIGAAGTWIGLMALSRMYLGRHFAADAVGGFVVGVAGLALACLTLPSGASASSHLSPGTRTALAVSVLVLVALTTLSGAGLNAHSAGRFCGLVGAALLLTRTNALDDVVTPATRVSRVAAALVLLSVALWSSTWTMVPLQGCGVVSMLAVSAALHASVVLVPALAIGDRRS